jgi:competence protein ComEC
VGQGDSILIQFPNGENVLIDGGDTGRGDDVVAYLRSRNVGNLALVVSTHPHSDHIAGLLDVLQVYGVGQFVDNGMIHTTATYQGLYALIGQQGIPVRAVREGDTIDVDPSVRVDVLGPPEPLIRGSRSGLNANSVVVLVDYDNTEFLFVGDAELETEEHLIPLASDIDVLKVGHHGSRYASSDAFLSAFTPEVGVISVGADNRYGHPHRETLDRLAAHGIVVYRTDLNGNIVVTTDGITYAISTAVPHANCY